MNVPAVFRASNQLKRAVRAPPTCSEPVGEGANLTRTGVVPSMFTAARRRPNRHVESCLMAGVALEWEHRRAEHNSIILINNKTPTARSIHKMIHSIQVSSLPPRRRVAGARFDRLN